MAFKEQTLLRIIKLEALPIAREKAPRLRGVLFIAAMKAEILKISIKLTIHFQA